ncbi:MAG: NAD(P)-binding domain-containing protein [Planctomycetota bacterium]
MPGLLRRYADWLHLRWPSGSVERLPDVAEDGSTRVPGLYVCGDLRGVPLLKFSADTGARVVRRIHADPAFTAACSSLPDGVHELVVVGAGVSGMAAALEARRLGIGCTVLEASEPFSTIVNFPRGKPIYTYPTDMVPAGELELGATVKEALLDELRAQTTGRDIDVREGRAEAVRRRGGLLEVEVADGAPLRALRVVVAIGRSGNFRRLGVPGEDLPKVYNRLHDPKAFAGQDVLVVGGGDSAIEAAAAIAAAGGRVVLSYRRAELARPKPENRARVEALAAAAPAGGGSLTLAMPSEVVAIGAREVVLREGGAERRLPNDSVLPLIGREPPLDFFRRSGVPIRGEGTWRSRRVVAAFFVLALFLYLWKSGTPVGERLAPDAAALQRGVVGLGGPLAAWARDPSTLLGTLLVSMSGPAFWFTLLYTTAIAVFGVRRIRRRRTPYVTWQTVALFLFQALPLFLLPEVILPWLGHNGAFDDGLLGGVADELFPRNGGDPVWGAHPRDYWRAYGLILAWPLNVYNVFTGAPIWGWLAISFVQTFVLIPLIVLKWGKGAYCGWICSCGGLAETVGDTLRRRMPHGPGWNRLNLLGQVILAVCFVLLAVRVAGWVWPGSWPDRVFPSLLTGAPFGYKWVVDVSLAGFLGVGLYLKWSGRVWCRFACPLAALMHVYARFSRFRILPDKDRCISCNECTSVCHQGIDVMSFANKGEGMADPECVRCSACVWVCPTGTLTFGEVDPSTGAPRRHDRLPASPVLMRERGRGD